MKRSERLWCSLLFMAGVLIYSSPASARRAPPAPATGTFNHMVFTPTTGRVGYHMFAKLGNYDWDLPTGKWETCDPANYGLTATGTIPPGLALVPHAPFGFDGTPRQPGDWTVIVTIGRVACTQGPDQTVYGPRTVEVHFHIEP